MVLWSAITGGARDEELVRTTRLLGGPLQLWLRKGSTAMLFGPWSDAAEDSAYFVRFHELVCASVCSQTVFFCHMIGWSCVVCSTHSPIGFVVWESWHVVRWYFGSGPV